MKTVYKYIIERDGDLELPVNYEVLHVAYQGDKLCMWALVDTDKANIKQRFKIFGTGHEMDASKDYKYIGTIMENPFVWHLFQVIEP